MTLLPTTILRVILIGVPPSTWWPTSPSQTITFSTVLPSILKTIWYPACLLELQGPKSPKPQSTVNLSRPLYPTFVVYLTTIGGRFVLHRVSPLSYLYFQFFQRTFLLPIKGSNLFFQQNLPKRAPTTPIGNLWMIKDLHLYAEFTTISVLCSNCWC